MGHSITNRVARSKFCIWGANTIQGKFSPQRLRCDNVNHEDWKGRKEFSVRVQVKLSTGLSKKVWFCA